MKTKYNLQSHEQVSPELQTIYDVLTKAIGSAPNLYAALAHSENALNAFLTAQNSKSSLTEKEKEVVNLIVSQVPMSFSANYS